MIHVSSESAHRYDRVKRKGAAFFTNLFKSRKLALGMKINEDEEMERAPRVETPGKSVSRPPTVISERNMR